jgi:hypothetical protein
MLLDWNYFLILASHTNNRHRPFVVCPKLGILIDVEKNLLSHQHYIGKIQFIYLFFISKK